MPKTEEETEAEY
uniref:Uncharacterized protein n=1 Tax=Arundo donax TaxID=35708 RepID=A0A0A8ZTJ0_ARUDO